MTRDKLRVLIVEDEPITAMDEAEIMRSLGHEVVGTVFSGDAALARAEIETPDVALVDIMLSTGTTGLEVANKLVEKYQIPIVFVSVLGSQMDVEKTNFPAGIQFVNKPYTPEELARAVSRVVAEAGVTS